MPLTQQLFRLPLFQALFLALFQALFEKGPEKGPEKSPKKGPEKGPEKGSKKQHKVGKSQALDERATFVLETLRQNPYVTRRELAKKLGVSEKQARSAIELLKRRDSIRHEGPAKGGYWVVNE